MNRNKDEVVGKRCYFRHSTSIGLDFSHAPWTPPRLAGKPQSTYNQKRVAMARVLGVPPKELPPDFPSWSRKGSSKLGPRAIGWDWKRQNIYLEQAREHMAEIVKKKNITPEMVVEEIAQIAFCSTGAFQDSMKVSTKDKLRALDMLARWLGLYERDNKQRAGQQQVLQVAFVGKDVEEQAIGLAKEIHRQQNTSNAVIYPELEIKEGEVLERMVRTRNDKKDRI